MKELGLKYQSIEDRTLLRSDELKKIHPLGKMPAVIIDGVPLFESLAICTYLVDQTNHLNLFAAAGTWSRALHDQWVLFNLTELETWLWSTAVNTLVLPEEDRIPDCIHQNAKKFKKGATVLDQYLSNKEYFVDDRFTVTDIIIDYTLNWARMRDLIPEFKYIQLYQERLLSRRYCELPE